MAKQEEELAAMKDRCTKQLEYLKEVQKYKANPSGPIPQPPLMVPSSISSAGTTNLRSSCPTSPSPKRLSSGLASPVVRHQFSMPSPRQLSSSTNSSGSLNSGTSTPRVLL